MLRYALIAGHIAMFCAVLTWMYASDRNNALNIGGATGDVTFWMHASELGFCAAVLFWVFCIVAAVGAAWSGALPSRIERAFWVVLPFVTGPVVAYACFLSAWGSVHAQY